MPKVSVYLSAELYAQAKAHSLPISSLAQQAIEDALRKERKAAWVQRARTRPARVHREIDVPAVMDEVRDELGK